MLIAATGITACKNCTLRLSGDFVHVISAYTTQS